MKVLAALSGGVDSAVAAALAVEAGHEVVGVHMALSTSPQECRIGSRGCCSVEDAGDAARAAEILGIPFYVWDLAEHFEETVITDFVEQYRKGATPNPCVRCNEFVKFRELAERARALGFDAVCTGHYARIENGEAGPELHRAHDKAKDQSYVLAVMGEEELSRVFLPLGSAPNKDWVRSQALARNLGVSNKPDSYDICFIPDGDTQGFLRAHLGTSNGDIVNDEGEVVGSHQGYWNFTVGQRRGLHLGHPSADGRPRYVLKIDPVQNQVVVGAAELLSIHHIDAEDVVWLASDDLGATAVVSGELGGARAVGATVVASGDAAGGVAEAAPTSGQIDEGEVTLEDDHANDGQLRAQVRAHGKAVKVSAIHHHEPDENGVGTRIRVDLAEPLRGVAAGQSLVIYRGSRVLGQATISGTSRRAE